MQNKMYLNQEMICQIVRELYGEQIVKKNRELLQGD